MWNSSFLIHCLRFPNFVHFNPFSIFKLFSDSLKFQLSSLPLGNRTEYPISSIFLISKLFFEYGKTIARCSISSQEFTKRDCLTMNHFIIWRTSSNFSRIKISTIYLFFFNPQFFQILQQRRFIVKSTKTWSSYTPSSFNQNANLSSMFFGFSLQIEIEICNDPRKLAEWIRFESDTQRNDEPARMPRGLRLRLSSSR